MKNRTHLLLAVICAFASCPKEKSESTSATESAGQPASECFAYSTEKDSAFLHMNLAADGMVKGDLEYKLFEKDRNEGKIEGKMHGDTLFAQYKFMSEGVESVREVAFLKRDGGWVEGFGPVAEKEGAMQFTDRSKLDFAKGLAFKNSECP